MPWSQLVNDLFTKSPRGLWCLYIEKGDIPYGRSIETRDP